MNEFIKDGSKDVNNISEFKNLKYPYSRVNLLGRNTPGDNLGGEYFYDPKSNETPNDITIVKIKNAKGRYERITTNLASLQSTPEEIDNVVLQPFAYASYNVRANLSLTSNFQKVTGWTPIVSPLNISVTDGEFLFEHDGVYSFDLERIYTNYDSAPTQPVQIYIEIRKNLDIIFERDAVIAAATKSTEPNVLAISSPFIFLINSNDKIQIRVRATMNGGNPDDCRLFEMQASIQRIHNLS